MSSREEAFAALGEGDRRALSRLLTRLEAGDREVREAAFALEWPEGVRVVAGTGPPGVGKSVLLAALAARYLEQGVPVAILAVDPTSPASGGALLGDRVRLPSDRGAIFLRSMAARDRSEGLSPESEAALRLMAVAGFRRILLETAGVGQGDTGVTRLADLTMAVTAPALGDAVQAAKAGLFEVADLVIVNQADRPGAEATVAGWRSMRPEGAGPVLSTTAATGAGVPELAAAIEATLAARSPKPRRADGDGALAGRLDHVGIATADSTATARIWEELLGLRVREVHEAPEFSVVARFLAPGGAEPESGGARLELVEPTDPASPVARFLGRQGPGLHHVCFEVRDIRRAMERLRERGARLLDEEPRPGAGGHLVAFVHPKSAGGVLLELKQGRRE